MKNLYRLLACSAGLFLLVSMASMAQEKCGTMSKHDHLMQTDAKYKTSYEQSLEAYKQLRQSGRMESTQGTVYKVPVVVHIMHNGEAVGSGSNITNDQVYSAIVSMNHAYRKKSGTIYEGDGVDMEIEFCLAQKDPNGNPTTGINRVNASATGNYNIDGITDANEVAIKNLSKWANTKYYNIWVVSEIDGNNGGSGVQGYAYFAGASATYDGAVMLYNAFGYDPEGDRGYLLKSYTNKNITCIHELGHAFGLYHTFEGDNGGTNCPTSSNGCGSGVGDCCADIPAHIRSSSNCVSGTNTCDGVTSRELFIHNYMDYSSDDCQNMFTANQYTRARNQLTSLRSNLISSSNLTACGCNGNTAPIARFYALNKQPCEGFPVQFIDESVNAPSSYSWTFGGGSPATSASQDPMVSFNGAGPYTVSLTVTSSGGQSNTATKTAYIAPLAGYTGTLPFTESFEGSFPPSGWTSVSSDAQVTWGTDGTKQWDQRTVAGSSSGTQAAAMNFYNYNYSGRTDDLVAPSVNLEGVNNPSLSFDVAFKRYSTGNSDSLQVLVTSDCGETYTSIYKKGGLTLQTTVLGGSNFAPQTSADWRTETVDLSAFAGQRIKLVFRGMNDYGDNLYLDNINLTGTYSAPVADFTASKTSGVSTDDNILFTDASTGNITSYSWNFGAGANPQTADTEGPHTVTYSSSGSKTITLTVTGPGGTNTATKTNYVSVVTSVISSSALENAGIKVYPNPAKDIVYVQTGQAEEVSVEVFDVLTSQVIGKKSDASGKLEIDLSGKPQGLYLMMIKTPHGNYGTRIVKSN